MANLSLSSKSIHADDFLNRSEDIAPPLHVSATFRYPSNPDLLHPFHTRDPHEPYESHIYSRHTAPNSTRLETVLTTILNGQAITYSSGLSAFHAFLTFLNPRRVAISGGYHGCHGTLGLFRKLTGCEILSLDCPAEALQQGDLVHIETPLNPLGTCINISSFAAKAHSRGAYLSADATFGPPPLQDPFLWGADVVMHSGTKYIGGHSDMLCGVLAISEERRKLGWVERLKGERLFLGSVMGSLEGWLGVRSVRTLELRVERQARNAGRLVGWSYGALNRADGGEVCDPFKAKDRESAVVKAVVERVEHASLQKEEEWLLRQMPNGFGPVFGIVMKDEDLARKLPSKLSLFHHATSLGGVESLIEWRTMTDATCDTRLLRVSVGIEGWEDLRDDLLQGFTALIEDGKHDVKHPQRNGEGIVDDQRLGQD